MEIAVVGKKGDAAADSDHELEDSEGSDIDLNQSYLEDNRISQKHQKFTDLESRAKEDMDFPDEIDTPLD